MSSVSGKRRKNSPDEKEMNKIIRAGKMFGTVYNCSDKKNP